MRLTLALFALFLAACSSEATPRPQLLVVVDTDLPVTDQIGPIAPQAAVDTLRVDIIGPDGSVTDFLDVVAPNALDWPISFGVAPIADDDDPVLLRLRLFRGRDAVAGENSGRTTIEPPRYTSVDRLASLRFPTEGVRRVLVALAADCLGVPARFDGELRTCLDTRQRSAPPGQGFTELGHAEVASRVGSYPRAQPEPCAATAPAGALCVPGGIRFQGDAALVGLDPGQFLESTPTRPVYVNAFYMDRHEFSVGRFRQLLASGAIQVETPDRHSPGNSDRDACTFLGMSSSANDTLPLNCVSFEAAQALCGASGGSLPSEAEWEHAARGRGRDQAYSWGNEPPACCSASLSRLEGSPLASIGECPGYGPQTIASRATESSCDGPLDVSLDGIEDLAGNLAEYTLDAAESYSASCWGELGVLDNPVCQLPSGVRVSRGGSWADGQALGLSALRRRVLASIKSPTLGFRCVYRTP